MKSSIPEFSEQWTSYQEQSGHYASEELLADRVGPLLELKNLAGKSVVEIGSGNGRILKIIANYAEHVTGIEPSDGVKISEEYTRSCSNVSHLNKSIYEVSLEPSFDIALCIGVLHHLPDPIDAAKRIRQLLKPSGYAIIWVYGREGNRAYLALTKLLRLATIKVPHRILNLVAGALVMPLRFYIWLASSFPLLPMSRYVTRILSPCDDYALKLVIYDQLNPSIANYWSEKEFTDILTSAGFKNIKTDHRHGYSWTALAN